MRKTSLKVAILPCLVWALWCAPVVCAHAQVDSSSGQAVQAEKVLRKAAPSRPHWVSRTVAGGFAILLGLQCAGRVIPRGGRGER